MEGRFQSPHCPLGGLPHPIPVSDLRAVGPPRGSIPLPLLIGHRSPFLDASLIVHPKFHQTKAFEQLRTS